MGVKFWDLSVLIIFKTFQFCKAYLGIGKTSPNDLTLVECGRYFLFVDYNMKAKNTGLDYYK